MKLSKDLESYINKLSSDLETFIGIDWPIEKIQEEYRKQQDQKNLLLFGPNWGYKGEILDIDNAKKEVYLWKRNEEKRLSMNFA
jgi:hypothetical protein